MSQDHPIPAPDGGPADVYCPRYKVRLPRESCEARHRTGHPACRGCAGPDATGSSPSAGPPLPVFDARRACANPACGAELSTRVLGPLCPACRKRQYMRAYWRSRAERSPRATMPLIDATSEEAGRYPWGARTPALRRALSLLAPLTSRELRELADAKDRWEDQVRKLVG